MPAPLVGIALRAAAGLAAKKGAKRAATKAAKKAAPSKAAKAAAKNLSKPVPKSKKPLAKVTGVKAKGFKKPLPETTKWTGTAARRNSETANNTMNTMRPLTSLEKAGFAKPGTRIGGVRVTKANAETAANLNKIRTRAGMERELAAAKRAEEIRKAKATQRLLDIKNNKKFK
jgi:hypothetical protein